MKERKSEKTKLTEEKKKRESFSSDKEYSNTPDGPVYTIIEVKVIAKKTNNQSPHHLTLEDVLNVEFLIIVCCGN